MLDIGWAIQDMTPDRPVMLQGQMHRRIAREAMDPLLVTALAIEGGDPTDCAVIVSCDLCMVPNSLQAAVRERLAQRPLPLPADRVLLTATHTHTSLVLEDGSYDHPGGDVMTPEECETWVAGKAVDAAAQAWENRSRHTIGLAFEHAVVGHNRRATYADGTAQMYGRTERADFLGIEGPEDHSLDIMFTWDAGGRLSGVVLDIPCPSQVDEHLEVMSADFWHDIRLELRARFGDGLYVLPLCGAAGDISPHFLLYGREEERMRSHRGVSERQEIAGRVRDAVARALACTSPSPGDTPFAHAVRRAELSPREITQAERDWAQAEYQRAIRDDGPGSWWPRRLSEVVERFDGQRNAEPVPVEIHAMRVGDAVVATNPFELFLDYGLRIKARSPASQTLIVQLAAGRRGYLPTQRAVRGGGYSAVPSSTQVGPAGAQELIEHTLQMIREIFPANAQASD